MLNLNLELLRQRSQEIRESVAALKEYAQAKEEQFVADRQMSDAAKYRLLVAIEGCITICNHLVSRMAKKAPATFAECFENLRDQRIISQALCENLKRMSRFRNLLIHGYWKIDNGKVYEILRKDLTDFESYLASLEKVLKGENSKP